MNVGGFLTRVQRLRGLYGRPQLGTELLSAVFSSSPFWVCREFHHFSDLSATVRPQGLLPTVTQEYNLTLSPILGTYEIPEIRSAPGLAIG